MGCAGGWRAGGGGGLSCLTAYRAVAGGQMVEMGAPNIWRLEAATLVAIWHVQIGQLLVRRWDNCRACWVVLLKGLLLLLLLSPHAGLCYLRGCCCCFC